MATFGAPKSYGNDCKNAYEAALEILDKLISRPWNSLFEIIPDTLIKQLIRKFKLEVY